MKAERKRLKAICETFNELVTKVSSHETKLRTAVQKQFPGFAIEAAAANERVEKKTSNSAG